MQFLVLHFNLKIAVYGDKFTMMVTRRFLVFGAILSTLLSGCGGGGSSTVNTIAIYPTSVTTAPGSSKAFAYNISGNITNPAVVWSVQEPNGGTIDTSGVYTAPSTVGTYHVVVTSVASPTLSAISTVTVSNSGVVLTVSQHNPIAQPSTPISLAQFVTVTGTTNTAVTWQVLTPNGGTITTSGTYTPPAVAGNYVVQVQSVADPTRTDLITVDVISGTISITPTSISLRAGTSGTFGYSLSIQGTSINTVNWATTDASGNPVTGQGSITSAGVYTAPSTPGTYYVTVSSTAVPQIKATATITVTP